MGLISRVSSRTYSNMSISALIIGASRGIGLELTRHLVAKQNHSVIATCRKLSADLENLSNTSKNLQVFTSRMGSIADNGSGGIYGYRMSKAAVNAAGKSLSIDLKDKQVSVALIHPGFVKTDMT